MALPFARILNICKQLIEIDAQSVLNIITFHYTLLDASHPCGALIIDYRSIIQHFEESGI